MCRFSSFSRSSSGCGTSSSNGEQWSGSRRFKTFFIRGLRWLWRLILIFAIGYIFIVYPIYFLFTVHYPIAKQVSDTQFILSSFANGPTPAGAHCTGMRCLADLDIWMAKNPVLRPLAQYMLGVLMVLQRADGGNTIYFLGHVAGAGGWIYFPLLFLLKEPIPTLIIVSYGARPCRLVDDPPRPARRRGGRGQRILDYIGVNFAEFSMASFIVLYWGYSMQSPLNIGVRHLMPTLPFIYILAAGVWKKWVTNVNVPAGTHHFRRGRLPPQNRSSAQASNIFSSSSCFFGFSLKRFLPRRISFPISTNSAAASGTATTT